MKKLMFVKTNPNAFIPTKKHATDSGMDLSSVEECVIEPHGVAFVHTGIGGVIPKGYELQVRPRSGLSSNGIICAFGTVDEGYRGEICAILYNFTNEQYKIGIGDRIAQLVLSPVVHDISIETGSIDDLYEPTDRNADGFGSTGV